MSRASANSSRKKLPSKCCKTPCSIEKGMSLLNGKWKGSILWHLGKGSMRFNDLVRLFAGASKKMIDLRLKQMEKHGLVKREVLSTKPLAVLYSITDFGRSALEVLRTLKIWVENEENYNLNPN
jgi:DNA-binding HxlR family transcriptional regulator